MAMKQTQTKLFAFSDVGIDISTGSRALFPDRFKRMFVQGYNVQTVSNVTVSGNQVTLTYGGSHGYVADRVLKIDSGNLAAINNGEFCIDSVTTNTVTMTIDDAPLSIAGGFATRVAPLGWELVYEVANHIHLYKLKHKDNSDLYLRLVFQTLTNARHGIAVCVGKTANEATGVITDPFAYTANTDRTDANSDLVWDFRSNVNNDSHANWTYSQGASTYGEGYVIGSLYHVGFNYNMSVGSTRGNFCGVFPVSVLSYDQLDYPLVIGGYFGSSHTTSVSSPMYLTSQRGFIGQVEVIDGSSNTNFLWYAAAAENSLSGFLDSIDTLAAQPLPLYEKSTRQFLGVAKGIYKLNLKASVNLVGTGTADMPRILEEADYSNKILHAYVASSISAGTQAHVIMPMEPVL